jgi:hypothetical protein
MKPNHLPLLSLALVIATSLAACAGTPESDTDAAAAGAQPTSVSGMEAAASATASPAQPIDSGQSLAEMDKNKDGSLTQDELAENEMLRQHFTQADKDGNGSLSQAEVDAHRTEMAGKPR